MKLRHLKYALETERSGSITKAAQNLYIAQPNLSKALKELEVSVGITIFKRTPQGVETTAHGKEFLEYAQKIVDQVDNLELLYNSQGKKVIRLRIGSVRSSNVAHLVSEFVNSLPKDSPLSVEFRETSQFDLLDLIESNEIDIGMISFPIQHKPYFSLLMNSKNIAAQPIRELPVYLLISTRHPLANVETVDIAMLADYTEVIHGDLDSPIMQYSKFMSDAGITIPHRSVRIFDRGSLMDILSKCHDCYKWTDAIHPDLLEAFNLIAKKCENNIVICEMAIHSRDRRLNKFQRSFMKLLKGMADYSESQ
jgi:DNA-binding transcriptional LysR family regulator